jgi:hypothetical protein
MPIWAPSTGLSRRICEAAAQPDRLNAMQVDLLSLHVSVCLSSSSASSAEKRFFPFGQGRRQNHQQDLQTAMKQ